MWFGLSAPLMGSVIEYDLVGKASLFLRLLLPVDGCVTDRGDHHVAAEAHDGTDAKWISNRKRECWPSNCFQFVKIRKIIEKLMKFSGTFYKIEVLYLHNNSS